MTQIFNAKTVEDAKELAARTFGVSENEIQFEILEEPKRGLFGIGKKGEARVKATYVPITISEPETDTFEEEVPPVPAQGFTETPVIEIPEEEPVSKNATITSEEEPMSENATITSEEEPMSENATITPEEEPMSENATITSEEEPMSENATIAPEEEPMSENATIAPEEKTMSENATVAPEEKTMSENATVAPEKISAIQPDDELITGEPSEVALAKIEKAKEYLTGILETMGVKAELKVNAGSDSAIIEIQTSSSGAVIGKRGETLDSLQYLTFMAANRADKEYYRIILNTANYRERRRKTLEELANKIAKNVLHSHRSTTLEPMNPYERRIIHSAIAEIEGVSSKSTGEEPYRKVVISSTEKPQRSGKRRNYHDKNEKGDGRNRGRNHGRHENTRRNSDAPPTRISMDSMKTSFEKDYKRPKPEDDLNAGLYGKIEF
ncbi:MAG: Jag N-terminal domain-containing protein [Oscillospiraceae bacterium]|nr:Jag N-terminal domain-containing protein [Oscillospiraceae bacterium]